MALKQRLMIKRRCACVAPGASLTPYREGIKPRLRSSHALQRVGSHRRTHNLIDVPVLFRTCMEKYLRISLGVDSFAWRRYFLLAALISTGVALSGCADKHKPSVDASAKPDNAAFQKTMIRPPGSLRIHLTHPLKPPLCQRVEKAHPTGPYDRKVRYRVECLSPRTPAPTVSPT